jgi:hypothetical protein
VVTAAGSGQYVEHVFEPQDYDEVLVDQGGRESVKAMDGVDVGDVQASRLHAWREALPAVDAVLQGKHSAVMAYGQTGSGKVRAAVPRWTLSSRRPALGANELTTPTDHSSR